MIERLGLYLLDKRLPVIVSCKVSRIVGGVDEPLGFQLVDVQNHHLLLVNVPLQLFTVLLMELLIEGKLLELVKDVEAGSFEDRD